MFYDETATVYKKGFMVHTQIVCHNTWMDYWMGLPGTGQGAQGIRGSLCKILCVKWLWIFLIQKSHSSIKICKMTTKKGKTTPKRQKTDTQNDHENRWKWPERDTWEQKIDKMSPERQKNPQKLIFFTSSLGVLLYMRGVGELLPICSTFSWSVHAVTEQLFKRHHSSFSF